MRRLPLVLVAAGICLLAAGPLPAGQVRVNVGSDPNTDPNNLNVNVFDPPSVTINPGDYVVWVWLRDGHTVTSGAGGIADGKFHTDGTLNAGAAYSWKSVGSGPFPYFCQPHYSVGMTGTINFGAVDVPDFRITEVEYDLVQQHDKIEIANLGGVTGNLGRYRLATPIDTVIVPVDDFLVPAGGRVTVYVNCCQDLYQSAPTTLYLTALLDLGDAKGNLSLLVPNTNPTTSSFARPDQVIDFVQWGQGGLAGETVAVAAGLWTAGDFIPTVSYGHSIEFCGTAGQYGLAYWAEVAEPNIGENGGCSTPARSTSWGRIKILYR